VTADAEPVLALAAGLRALAPSSILTGARRIDGRDEVLLLDGEAEAIRDARPRRRSEFASGRVLLRDLIGRDVAIPVGSNRAPLLPPDVRGALAHDDHFVVAAVTCDARTISIGIDIEPVETLEETVAQVILRPDDAHLDAHLAFTLKEAAYKAWSFLGGRMLEPHDVRVTTAGSGFRAEVVPDGTVFKGSYGTAANRWIALVTVELPSSAA
jgi:4'-phosphopantetheinyl transferase EntD